MVYAQSLLPIIQKQFENISDLNDAIENKKIRASFVESYQVSIALNGPTIQFSTQSHLVNKVLQLDNFEIDSVGNITQLTEIEGETYRLYFSLDIYHPDFQFDRQTATTACAQQWLQKESTHLLKNATIIK